LPAFHPAFALQSEAPLPEYGTVASRFRHGASGADVLVLPCNDADQVFAVCFDTLPPDSSGIAHLLEHMIFRGSQRFPASNLYSALQQGTMQSALNASTLPDRTIYHFGSPNEEDFANLLEVLLDAVLHPRLRPEHLEEEKSVLQSELEGHRASAINCLEDGLRRGLHPGTVYDHDHGGDPELVGAVSASAIQAFHARFYHPSHARIYLSGPVDLAMRFEQIDRAFAGQGQRDPLPHIALPAVTAPRRLMLPHPSGGSRGPVGVAWAFRSANALGRFGWPCLDLALTSQPNGFLRERLPLLGARGGLAAGLPPGAYSLLLDGQTADTAEAQIGEALAEAAAELPPHLAQEAAGTLELRLREERGLAVFNRVLGSWRHGGNPLTELSFAAELSQLRQRLGDGDAMRALVAHDLRDNPHRLTVSLEPGAAPVPRLPSAARPVSVPPPTALPVLTLTNLPRRLRQVAVRVEGRILDIAPRDGVLLADLGLGLAGLTDVELALTPLLARCLGRDGLDTLLWAGTRPSGKLAVYLILRCKALPAQAGALAARLEATVSGPLPDPATVMALLAEETALAAARPAATGHILADLRLRAASGPAGAANERMRGLSTQEALRRLDLEDPQRLRAALVSLREKALGQNGLRLAVSGGQGIDWQGLLTRIGRPDGSELPPLSARPAVREAIPVALPMNTVGQSLQLDPGLPLALAAHALETGWLWDSLRVAGGAYGVRAWHDPVTGMLTQISARDPQLLQTLDRMTEAPSWVARNLRGDALERYRVGAVARLDRPMAAGAEMLAIFQRHLTGITENFRMAELETVLRASDADVVRLAEAMAAAQPGAGVAVLGSAPTLQAALRSRPGAFTITPQPVNSETA
jgi:Zn-dependent M16 (insulinase) family peptidase